MDEPEKPKTLKELRQRVGRDGFLTALELAMGKSFSHDAREELSNLSREDQLRFFGPKIQNSKQEPKP